MNLCTNYDLVAREPALLRVCRSQANLIASGFGDITGYTVTGNDDWMARGGTTNYSLLLLPTRSRTAVLVEQVDERSWYAVVPYAGLRATYWNYTGEHTYTGPGDARGLAMEVYTFPQIESASFEIYRHVGIPLNFYEGQFDTMPLRSAATYRTLATIFRSMSAMDREVNEAAVYQGVALTYNARYAALADWYDKQFAAELRRIRLAIDENFNGKPEKILAPGTVIDTRRG